MTDDFQGGLRGDPVAPRTTSDGTRDLQFSSPDPIPLPRHPPLRLPDDRSSQIAKAVAADDSCIAARHPSERQTLKVTRIEVIDETGRVFSRWNTSIELSYQDDGRTLKVFVAAVDPILRARPPREEQMTRLRAFIHTHMIDGGCRMLSVALGKQERCECPLCDLDDLRAALSAAPSSGGTVPSAHGLIRNLLSRLPYPDRLPAPTIVVEDDGDLCLDWDERRDATVSASISESGNVGWAALIGDYKSHGHFQLPAWSDEFNEAMTKLGAALLTPGAAR